MRTPWSARLAPPSVEPAALYQTRDGAVYVFVRDPATESGGAQAPGLVRHIPQHPNDSPDRLTISEIEPLTVESDGTRHKGAGVRGPEEARVLFISITILGERGWDLLLIGHV